MLDNTKLLSRLRDYENCNDDDIDEAVKVIESQEKTIHTLAEIIDVWKQETWQRDADNKKLWEKVKQFEGALKPFAELDKLEWKGTMFENRGEEQAVFYHHQTKTEITIGDFRRARKVIEEVGNDY
jgi:hypothetical protein